MQLKVPSSGKVLVRKISLNKFMGPAGRWVKTIDKAFTFPNPLNAINTCLARRLKDVELILHFGGNAPDFRIPLDAV